MKRVPSELIRKYNVPGPRYTSYPTVPYWEAQPSLDQWIDTVKDSADTGAVGAAIYVHVPFCKSLCTYCGCNTRITRKTSVGEPYIQTVLKEWGLYQERIGTGRVVSELHLGGGTPTFLSPQELDALVSGIMKTTRRAEAFEFSVEADPRVTTDEQLSVLAGLGFRRLSLGIQDFDPTVQESVNRVQTALEVRRVTEDARKRGFTSINYDLIYGLPFQTRKSVEETIRTVTTLRPDRIAFYAYAHVPWIKPSQRRFTEADLPSGDEKRVLYELGRSLLEDAGYREIGMDHFALESDSLWKASVAGSLHRSFMGYTSRQIAPLIGLGVSSISDSWGAFIQNEKVLETYTNRVEKGEIPIARGHILNEEDRILRRHILNLMTRFETSWASADLYVSYLDEIRTRLSELERDGLVELGEKLCNVTDAGRPFLRNICMAFDARLVRKAPQTQIFSKAI